MMQEVDYEKILFAKLKKTKKFFWKLREQVYCEF